MISAPAASPSTRTSSDLELVERVRAGDAQAMEALMRRHNRKLYRTARAILRDDAEAEDAVQDAYLQAFRGLARFRGEASFSTWLVRIAANEALMRRRRNAREAEVIPIHHDGREAAMEEVAAEPRRNPENEAIGAEMRRLLERRIDELPDLYRPVFVMRAVEEMTVEETAQALGLPEATVRTRYFRARALLRGALEQHLDTAISDTFAFDGARCDRIVRGVLDAFAKQPTAPDPT